METRVNAGLIELQIGGVPVTVKRAAINFLAPVVYADNSGNNSSDFSVRSATVALLGVIQLAQDLGGTALLPVVTGIRATPVSAAAPAVGHVLRFFGGQWEAGKVILKSAGGVTYTLEVADDGVLFTMPVP